MIVTCFSGPRNISTALMRSWSSRSDTYVSDEPFYAYYLNETKFEHPMFTEILEKYPNNFDEIANYLTRDIPKNKKIWYQKHMAHHLLDLKKLDWIKKCENCILIRHPKEVISSYLIKNKLNNIEELGYPQQLEIAKFLKKNNKSLTIIDSKEILDNPNVALKNWCKRININFKASMLKWKKGIHPYDGIWAKHWYDNVINSTEFQPNINKNISIEKKYDSIYNESMRCYNNLLEIK